MEKSLQTTKRVAIHNYSSKLLYRMLTNPQNPWKSENTQQEDYIPIVSEKER
jgi:hypothetical protein